MSKQKKFKSKREKARKVYLPLLLEKHGHQCYWCKSKIVMRRSISQENIVFEDHGVVTHLCGDIIIKEKLASVDHVKELGDGGHNGIQNCVPSCWFCNNNRSNRNRSNRKSL